MAVYFKLLSDKFEPVGKSFDVIGGTWNCVIVTDVTVSGLWSESPVKVNTDTEGFKAVAGISGDYQKFLLCVHVVTCACAT